MKSIDAVRGLAMVLMTLDHTRDFFHANSLLHNPETLEVTTPSIFFTRWITHFCAPAFVLLAGVGAFLWAEKGRSRREQSWFLFTRGIWLVLLELTVIRCLGWYFNFNYEDTPLGVIWAIGWSMIALAGLVYLPRRTIAVVAVAILVGHNLLDDVEAETFGSLGWLWNILHHGEGFQVLPGRVFRPVYPVLPWIGVIALGYVCGPRMSPRYPHRLRFFLQMGMGLTAGFILLRAVNVYGDPERWELYLGNPLATACSFVNCEKYPPSLLYLLMTLGPTFLALALFESRPKLAVTPLLTLGRVPFLFYLLHLPLIHGLAVLASLARYGDARWLFDTPPWSSSSREIYPEEYGYSLPVVYAIYFFVLVVLYPVCKRFADYKRRTRAWWLSYL
jgi:uncharacterized membrane protein